MTEWLTVEQVAERLGGIGPKRAANIMSEHGIRSVRMYPANALDKIQRPGQGARTDLRRPDMQQTISQVATEMGVPEKIVDDAVPGVWDGRIASEVSPDEVTPEHLASLRFGVHLATRILASVLPADERHAALLLVENPNADGTGQYEFPMWQPSNEDADELLVAKGWRRLTDWRDGSAEVERA